MTAAGTRTVSARRKSWDARKGLSDFRFLLVKARCVFQVEQKWSHMATGARPECKTSARALVRERTRHVFVKERWDRVDTTRNQRQKLRYRVHARRSALRLQVGATPRLIRRSLSRSDGKMTATTKSLESWPAFTPVVWYTGIG